MGYLKKIDESKQKVYNQSIATRILDLVDKLRLNSNEYDQRRWIWELLQNAKDASYLNNSVAISIDYNFENGELNFSHNGMPFSVDNITFLIEQVSTKERETEKNIKTKSSGKFGTGFLTTHLLSETVNLESVIKEENLPYKKFELTLDRSGRDINSIINSVNNSLKVLNELDDAEEFINFEKNDFNTSFSYQLDNEGVETAKKGLTDLELSIAYVLVFVNKINSIQINKDIKYELEQQTTLLNDNIEIYTVQKYQNQTKSEICIACISNGNVSVAIEVINENGNFKLVDPNSKTPRLFCDFPLIGTENFNFPAVINSSLFNPTEPRNGIYLTDKNDNKIIENKSLVKQACNLYIQLIEFASANHWNDLWVLSQFFESKNYEWLSKNWYFSEVLYPIREKLLTIPLIYTEKFGLIPILCGGYNGIPAGATVDFPKSKSNAITEKIWSLCQNNYFITPNRSDFTNWSNIIWDYKFVVDIKTLITIIEKKDNLTNISKTLGISNSQCFEWLNNLYALIITENLEKEAFTKAIFPNQNGKFLRKDDLLYEKEHIPEDLKDILFDLGIDIREKLMNNFISISGINKGYYDTELIANEIAKCIRIRLQEIERSEQTKKIFKKLYLWFNDNKEQSEKIFENLYKNKHKLLDDTEIVNSIQKAELLDSFMAVENNLSIERILQLLELEELSKGFNIEKKYHPDELQKRINFENGWKGEAFVYKKLIEKGLHVEWPNKSETSTQNNITDFDGEIHYIEDKGDKYDLYISHNLHLKTYIQVKTTNTDILKSDEIAMPISVREWNFVNETESENSYYIARVFNINHQPEVYFMKVENINKINLLI